MMEEKIQRVQVASIPVTNVKGLQMQTLVNRTKGSKRVVKQHVIYAVSEEKCLIGLKCHISYTSGLTETAKVTAATEPKI